MKKRKHTGTAAIVKLAAGLLAAAAVVCFFMFGLNSLKTGSDDRGLEQLETAVRRASVACYAAEGRYPPSLEYLQEHYGIQVDENHYKVYYYMIADNLMPDITVLELS